MQFFKQFPITDLPIIQEKTTICHSQIRNHSTRRPLYVTHKSEIIPLSTTHKGEEQSYPIVSPNIYLKKANPQFTKILPCSSIDAKVKALWHNRHSCMHHTA